MFICLFFSFFSFECTVCRRLLILFALAPTGPQTLREKNPHLHNLPVIINVSMDQTESFDLKKLLNGSYNVSVLGGQHICECDNRLLKNRYLKTPADEIPSKVKFKMAEVYVNLTSDEKSLVVNVANSQITYQNQWFDKVRVCQRSRLLLSYYRSKSKLRAFGF